MATKDFRASCTSTGLVTIIHTCAWSKAASATKFAPPDEVARSLGQNTDEVEVPALEVWRGSGPPCVEVNWKKVMHQWAQPRFMVAWPKPSVQWSSS